MTFFAMLDGIAKPIPMFPPDGRKNLAVDADQLALRVDQRAARVALVDGSVGLQEVFKAPIAQTGGAALRADDSHRDRLTDAQRVADRECDVADADAVRIAQREHGQFASLRS